MKKVREDDGYTSLASASSSTINIAIVTASSAVSPAAIMINKMTDIFVDSFCCCLIEKADEDPFIFKENSSNYLALCHLIHVKHLAVILVYLKTILFFIIVVLSFLFQSEILVKFAFALSFGLAATSYVLLYTGIKMKKFYYLLPFFFVSFMFIVSAVVHFFVTFLDSANTRDTMNSSQLISFIVQICAITLEVYSLLVVWRLFNYICDRVMCDELKKKGFYVDEPLLNTDEPQSKPSLSLSCASHHEINTLAASNATLNQIETIWNSKKKFSDAFNV